MHNNAGLIIKNKKEKIMKRLKIIQEMACNYTGPSTHKISDEKFNELCKKYGYFYGIDWYFVGFNRIKYFDVEWHYTYV